MVEYFPGDTFTRDDFNVDRTTDTGYVILPGGVAQWKALSSWNSEEFITIFLSADILFEMLSKEGEINQILLFMKHLSWKPLSGPDFAKALKEKFGPSVGKSENAEPIAEANAEAETSTDNPIAETEAEKPADNPIAEANAEAETSTDSPIAEAEAEKPADNPIAEAEAEKPADNPIAEAEAETSTDNPVAETEAEKPASERSADNETAGPLFLWTGSDIAGEAVNALTRQTLIETFALNLVQIGLIILLVSLIQYLRASTLPKEIAYRNVLTIMVYSTFPAQIAATLFEAAGLERFVPFLSFNLLFVCIFFVYQICAFRAVMKKVCPQTPRKDDDFSDSDF